MGKAALAAAIFKCSYNLGQALNYYSQYKPLRNLLRQFHLEKSIEDIWWYFQAVDIPSWNEGGWIGQHFTKYKDIIYKWELAILAREIVLNASSEGALRFRPWPQMARAINMLREVQNEMGRDYMTAERAYNSLSPTGHLQFHWQRPAQFNALMRYFKIFSKPEVESLLLSETGVSVKEWFFIGFASLGCLQQKSWLSMRQEYQHFGIGREQSEIVFGKLSQPVRELREKFSEVARYDDTWMYTWNPLEERPLVSLNSARPELVYCPIPYYVLKRVSQGLYYELYKENGFNNPFGASFQDYVGEVVREIFPAAQFDIFEEREYIVNRDRKDGVDWILTDAQANLFIECKAKRMTVSAKSAVDPDIIRRQVDFLVKAVIQSYKNIADALDGHTHWPRNGKPVFPIIVTLEDWHLFGKSADLLAEGVRTKMVEKKLDTAWLDSMPYTVVSCENFEFVSPTIAEVGIYTFFTLKKSERADGWQIQDFAKQQFNEVYSKAVRRTLFKKEWRNILPAEVMPKFLARDDFSDSD